MIMHSQGPGFDSTSPALKRRQVTTAKHSSCQKPLHFLRYFLLWASPPNVQLFGVSVIVGEGTGIKSIYMHLKQAVILYLGVTNYFNLRLPMTMPTIGEQGRFQKNITGSSFVGVVATPPKPLPCG